ncbi:aminotransferase class I/II-fold pyridoxal phosphate-dependent enzyme [Paeniglutamicibacter sulfureus]|uniref:aminotransferase class I/II-fold pyridoxal phosphate-dependent enzyme n=1 Tax=Paeniglutamicibacter sulfureus TaxID=43666 RepID=UPI0026665679|nr:aminotransferase class I/II-fold pyridoxal phosphate-dependent enzyme [Paeniglutamicibacter sulfureus]MDO2933434.1 aminotransferase class I/II-fold pyridoxal phosphate-dependent enzyme [Paeniglutamicibacter sulfureus]
MSHEQSGAREATPRPRNLVNLLPNYSRSPAAGKVRWVASSNESWMSPSPAAVAAMAASVQRSNRYPSLAGDRLVAALSDTLGLPGTQVAVGAGSLALLGQVLAAFAGPGDEVLYAWRSYEAYPILVTLAGARGVQVPLDAAHRHDPEAMLRAITERTAVVLLCNPNNPTGTVLGINEVESFLARVPGRVLVVLDEAYIEFSESSGDTLMLLPKYPNLVILRTFSKAHALAGARAGYLLGGEGIVRAIRKVAPPFGLSAVAEAGAVAALADTDYLLGTVAAVAGEREFLHRKLEARGIGVPCSGGNFLWIPEDGRLATVIERACAAHGVSVRAFDGAGVRVTIGPRLASLAILAALDEPAAARPPQTPQTVLTTHPIHSTGGAS